MKDREPGLSYAVRHPRKWLKSHLGRAHPSASPGPAPAPPQPAAPAPDRRPGDWTEHERHYLEKTFRPINHVLPEDIFLASYPKSGNTWVGYMLAGALFGVLQTRSQGIIVHDLIPDVHQSPVYKRYWTPTLFKSHLTPQPEYRNVIYLLRDGRDAMVSYWHYLQKAEGRPIDFLELVRDREDLFPCRWHEHVTSWMANPHGARMIVARYEDFLVRPVEEMERLCEFVGVKVERDFLQLVVDHASFQAIRASKQLLHHPDYGRVGEQFFRRGIAGSHRDEMPAEVLQAFTAQAGDVLREHGYCN